LGKKEIIRLTKKNPDILNYYCQEFLTINTFIPTPSGYVNPVTNNNWSTEHEVLEYLNTKERMLDRFKRWYLKERLEIIKNNYITKEYKRIRADFVIKDNLQPLYAKGTRVYLKIPLPLKGRHVEMPTKIMPLVYKYVDIGGKKVNTAYLYNEFKDGKLRLVIKDEPAITPGRPVPAKYLA
jgi:hypothetical protein